MDWQTVSLGLQQLQNSSQPRKTLSALVGNLDLFLSTLRAEGMDFKEERERISLVQTQGYGRYTLSWRLGCAVHYSPTCPSTNLLAREFLSEGPFVLVANEQTEGRGRMGRSWESEAGKNILCSFILRPPVRAQNAARCSLLWAAAIAAALDLFVKWPNDLVTKDGKKVGGILVELVDDTPTLILGLGLNVSQTDFPGLPQATSLALEDRVYDRAALLGKIYRTLVGVDLEQNLDSWRGRALHMGQLVQVNEKKGVFTGIREDGALLIDGTPVLAGDVNLVEGRP
ncbi:MAG: biotin--[acetyl-CoA-carboxylase] ligase [Myxococcota bacterium]|nr:biotin--[acetyl-CoA-carboxylase] ligase [Myxococcota bacterium]